MAPSGDVSVQAAYVAAFRTVAIHVMDDDDLVIAIGGIQSRNMGKDTFSCKLKWHDTNGETYYVILSRDTLATRYGSHPMWMTPSGLQSRDGATENRNLAELN